MISDEHGLFGIWDKEGKKSRMKLGEMRSLNAS
jgi:hypothetical protein